MTKDIDFPNARCFEKIKRIICQKSNKFVGQGAIVYGNSFLFGRTVKIIATDRNINFGTLGKKECVLIKKLIEETRRKKTPLVFLFDSGGARLSEGLSALGSFRLLYREFLKSRLSGHLTLGFALGNCYGGASLLAATCTETVITDKTLFAMSGPKLVFSDEELHSSDSFVRDFIKSKFGSEQRQEVGDFYIFCVDSELSYLEVLKNFLILRDTNKIKLDHHQEVLNSRLPANTCSLCIKKEHNQINIFLGEGSPVGAAEISALSTEILSLSSGQNAVIHLNSPCHSMLRHDEEKLIADYLVHVALCIFSVSARGIPIRLQIGDNAGGGVYVALAGSSDAVFAKHNSKIRLLPKFAEDKVMTKNISTGYESDIIKTGVVDEILNR